MNATASSPRVQASRRPLKSRIGNWFAETLRTGRVPALLVTVIAGIIVYGFLFTSDYAVDDISVRGADFGDPEEIALASGAFGISVYKLDPDEIARNIGSLPYVSRSEIVLHPDGKVDITILEKQPELAWRAGTDLFLVDKYGATIGTTSSSPLTTVYLETVQGEEFKVTSDQIAAVLAVKDAIGSDISQYEWRTSEGLTVILDTGQTVVFGTHQRMPQKLAVFSATIEQISATWRTLDVREPDTPYFK